MSSSAIPAVGARRAGADILVQFVARFGNLLLGVAVTLVLVRALGTTEFGQWSTILVVSQLAGYLTDFGLDQVVIRHAAAEPGDELRWVRALFTLKLLLSLPVTVVAVAVVATLSETTEMLVAGVVVCVSILLAAPSAVRTIFQLRVRNDVNMAVLTVNSVLWAVAVFAIAAAGASLVPLAVAMTGITAVVAVLQLGIATRIGAPVGRDRSRLWRELVRVGLPVGIGGLLILSYAKIDQVLVFELGGAHEAGLYGAVYRILDQSQFLPMAIMTTMAPLMMRAYEVDGARLRRLVEVTVRYLLIGSLGAFAVVLVLAKPLTELLFGASFEEAAPALPILVATLVPISLGYLDGQLVIAVGLQRRFVGFAIVALVFNVAANVILIPEYGFMAAAWVTLATEVIVIGLTASAVFSRLGWIPRMPGFIRVLAAATVLALAAVGLEAAGAPLVVNLILCGPLYLGLLLGFRAMSPNEVRAVLRKGRGKRS